MASLPRFPCPVCGRPVAVTERGRLYRHDPPDRPPGPLVSCAGSLKVARPPEQQPVLFSYVPPIAMATGTLTLGRAEAAPLF